jgi:UDP-N-acetylmuramoyl-tripeptide--D-alanyl-D-alanine ligase
MRDIAAWLQTDAVIITAIGDLPAHIEFFNSRQHLIEEKSQLIRTLKTGGLLVLNADDETVLDMKINSKNRVITYGFKEGADILASGDSISYNASGRPEGIIFRVDEGGNSLPVVIEGVFGRNHVYAALAALALSSGLKFNMLQAINSLKNYDVPPGRMRLLDGINDSLIIDDTYNSSPFACESALKTLKEISAKGGPASGGKCSGRKIAVLGDMLELGKYTNEAHKNIGQIARENCDVLIVVGPRAKNIKEGALEIGMSPDNIFEFLDSFEAGNFIKTFAQKGPPASAMPEALRAGDLILIKGSQGMRMERVVEAILLDQKNKNKLLVRQDEEWLKKK